VRQSSGQQPAGDDVCHRVETVRSYRRDLLTQIPRPAVEHFVSTTGAHGIGLVCCAERDDSGSTPCCEPHERKSDSTGSAADQNSLSSPDTGSFEHAGRSAVGDGQARQLGVGQRRLGDIVDPVCPHHHVLGIPTVGFAAEHPCDQLLRSVAVGQDRVSQDSTTHQFWVNATTHHVDVPADVSSLNAGEVDRTEPSSRLLNPVCPLTSPHIGVVDRRGGHPESDLARSGFRRVDVLHVEAVDATKTEEHDSTHGTPPGSTDADHPSPEFLALAAPWLSAGLRVDPVSQTTEADLDHPVRTWVPWTGLLVTLAIIAAAFILPQVFGWKVYPRATIGPDDISPLHGLWEPKPFGPGTIPAVLIAALGWQYGPRLAAFLTWRKLLLVALLAGFAWMVALAYVDGSAGISRVLGNPFEYLREARAATDVPAMIDDYIRRIPYSAPDNWVTHLAGHPPGALLFFVGLVRIGLGGDYAAGIVVTGIAATIAPAVMITLRTLDREDFARRAAPFLVLSPAAVFMAVSADAMFAAVAAWGMVCLAISATRTRPAPTIAWSVAAGLLLGYCVMLSYGLPLLGILAVAILLAARRWQPLPGAVVAAVGVIAVFAAFGFRWWEAYPVLRERYYEGVANIRPFSYWIWANLAALAISAGPAIGMGLARMLALGRRLDRTLLLVIGAGFLMIATANLSGMSKAEVERIWLPFIPWITLSLATLPVRWARVALAVQLVSALAVQHLLYTSW